MTITGKRIRVLIVDDSAVMRAVIRDGIEATSDMEVAGMAADGRQAIASLDTVRPDVITLDVQMPNMDGLATLEAILEELPTPVIMVSSLTQQGAGATLEALDRGAIDYVAKPERGADTEAVLHGDLIRKIRMAAGTDVKRILEIRRERAKRRVERVRPERAIRVKPDVDVSELQNKCIAIGISTGGPPALASLFETLLPPMPPIVIVQHMPPQFTKSLAWRLDSLSKLSVKEAETGDVLRPNHVILAPGGKHLKIQRQGKLFKAIVCDGPNVSGHKPSVDVMMTSVAAAFGANCLGVVMTGMGRDGSDGCRAIRTAGGYTLGQDEATSDVYGMNKVAFVEGNVDRQFGLDEAAAVITRQMEKIGRATAAAV